MVETKIHPPRPNGLILVEAFRDGVRVDSHYATNGNFNYAWKLAAYFVKTYTRKAK